MALSQLGVDVIDWVAFGFSGALLIFSVYSILYIVLFSHSDRSLASREFNFLWRARLLSQVFAALLALVLLLRLQVLWGPHSVWVPGGFYALLFCRIYTAVTFGLLEPAYLLLGLFSCLYSIQAPGTLSRPNTSILMFALGFTVPFCAAQVVCAIFTHLFPDLNYSTSWLLENFFAASDTQQTEHCSLDSSDETLPTSGDVSANCAFCLFPLLSTLISSLFALSFLLVAWWVSQRIVAAAINKVLIRRLRLLQVLLLLLLPASIICRGLTVIWKPFDLGFELLRLGYVVCVVLLVVATSFILVLKPVHDAAISDKHLKAYLLQHDLARPGSESEEGAAATAVAAEEGCQGVELQKTTHQAQPGEPQQQCSRLLRADRKSGLALSSVGLCGLQRVCEPQEDKGSARGEAAGGGGELVGLHAQDGITRGKEGLGSTIPASFRSSSSNKSREDDQHRLQGQPSSSSAEDSDRPLITHEEPVPHDEGSLDMYPPVPR